MRSRPRAPDAGAALTFSGALQAQRLWLGGILLLLAAVYATVIAGMARQWYSDENYSHGFIVPLISLYFLYERRAAISQVRVAPWRPGLAVILLGLIQLIFGFLATEYFTMRSSLLVVIAGLVLFLFGRELFRLILLPLAYLLFMVPLPYIIYNSIAFPLKLLVSGISIKLLQLTGVVAIREGNIIVLPALTLEVADACSGIRSLVSLLALAVACACYLHASNARRLVLVAATIPIAILTNSLRVIITGLLSDRYGAKVAEGFYHEFAGLAVFGLAMAMLLVLAATLKAKGEGLKAKGER